MLLNSRAICFQVFCASSFVVNLLHAEDWKPLLTGDTLSGWTIVEGPKDSWAAKDGVLTCSGEGAGWISTDREYSNFELSLEFRVPKGGNSGVHLRTPREGHPSTDGMEVQILDDYDAQYATLKPYQYTGSLYGVVPATPRVTKHADEWQEMKISLNGPKLKVTLNNTVVVDADLKKESEEVSDHPGLKRTTGFLGLQNHSTHVDFRNIQLRELP